jgi:transposase
MPAYFASLSAKEPAQSTADCLNAKSKRSTWCTKAELSGDADSENTTEAPHGHMYYIGLDVHKKTISYCVKDASGRVHQEGKLGATRCELDIWMRTLPQPWTVAMEATIFTGWI